MRPVPPFIRPGDTGHARWHTTTWRTGALVSARGVSPRPPPFSAQQPPLVQLAAVFAPLRNTSSFEQGQGIAAVKILALARGVAEGAGASWSRQRVERLPPPLPSPPSASTSCPRAARYRQENVSARWEMPRRSLPLVGPGACVLPLKKSVASRPWSFRVPARMTRCRKGVGAGTGTLARIMPMMGATTGTHSVVRGAPV